MRKRSRCPSVDGILTDGRACRATVDAIAAIQLPDGNIPWTPGEHTDPWNLVEAAMALDVGGRHDVRRARVRVAARACSTPTAIVARVLHRQRGQGRTRSTRTSRATSPTACGTTTSRPATPRSSRTFWPVVERGDRLRARPASARPARSRGAATSPRRRARCSPARRASTRASRCAIAIAERLGHERPDWELSLGSLAIAIAHRPDALPRQGPLGDGLVLPDPRRRAPRPRRARRGSRRSWRTFVVEGRGVRCVSDRPGSPRPRRASS